MRRIAFGIVAVSFALALVACSDDSGTKKPPDKKILFDKGPGTDGPIVTPPDGGPKPEKGKTPDQGGGACVSANIGKPCTKSGGECGATMTCLLTDSAGTKGICACKCTLDDPATPLVNEDSCPDLSKNRCVDQSETTTPDPWCMQLCDPKLGSNTCQGSLACIPWIGSYLGVYDKSICIITGCAADADCPVNTNTKCSLAAKDCPSGQTCTTYLGTTVTGDEGRCQLPGKCDTASGLCTDHTLGKSTAKIGDPCKDDRDCANNMECSQEFDRTKYQKKGGDTCTDDLQCCSGTCTGGKCDAGACIVSNRNGYCTMSDCAFKATLPSRACPTGSACNQFSPGGVCRKACDMTKAGDCRGNASDLFGDYECRNYGAYFADPMDPSSSKPMLDTPICETGAFMPCDTFASSKNKLDCSYNGTFDAKGTPTNTTNFKCRSYDNKILTNNFDPNGLCLDDTA
jgi:hypothetical protein